MVAEAARLATDQEYREFIDGYGEATALRALLTSVVKADKAAWDRDYDGYERGRVLEHLVLRSVVLELEATATDGRVAWPFSVPARAVAGPGGSGRPAEQIDGCVHVQGLSCLVECKAESAAVGPEPVERMHSKLLRRPAGTVGAIMSTSGFTEAAQILARFTMPQCVLLFHAGDVQLAVSRACFVAGLLAKYRLAVEQGVPNVELTELPGFGG
jgi:hypothetical protein